MQRLVSAQGKKGRGKNLLRCTTKYGASSARISDGRFMCSRAMNGPYGIPYVRSNQPQQRRHVINRTLDNQRFYRAAIFAAISIEFPIIAIGMRSDLRKPDACAAYWTLILGSYAKRYTLKAHELPFIRQTSAKGPAALGWVPITWWTYVSRDFASTDRFHSPHATNNCIKSLT